jgi:transposase
MTRQKKPTEYTFEFRENAIRLSKMPGRTVASVAQELKIPAWKLRNWLQESRVKLERSSDMDQLVRLQNELKRAKEEIEILKKAAAYFAKSLP